MDLRLVSIALAFAVTSTSVAYEIEEKKGDDGLLVVLSEAYEGELAEVSFPDIAKNYCVEKGYGRANIESSKTIDLLAFDVHGNKLPRRQSLTYQCMEKQTSGTQKSR